MKYLLNNFAPWAVRWFKIAGGGYLDIHCVPAEVSPRCLESPLTVKRQGLG